ncbi:MAG: 4Fe-4S binding protein [Cyanobacteria bacterium J06634_6]
MAYTITDKCINCQRCIPNCPTNAIETDGSTFKINADRCNNCLGVYSVPQCWASCPTSDGCVPSLTDTNAFALSTAIERSKDYWKAWFLTYQNRIARLKASQHSDYWNDWFESYACMLQDLQAQLPENAHQPLAP